MNRRQFAVALPAAAGLLTGCSASRARASLLNDPRLQDAMRSLESAIGGLVIDVSSIDQSNCATTTAAASGAAEQVRTSFEALKESLGMPNS